MRDVRIVGKNTQEKEMKQGTRFVAESVELPTTEAVNCAQGYIIRGDWIKNPYHNLTFAKMTALKSAWIASQMGEDIAIKMESLVIAALFCRFEHLGFHTAENMSRAVEGITGFFNRYPLQCRDINYRTVRQIIEESYTDVSVPTLIESYILRDAIRMPDVNTFLQDSINEHVVENGLYFSMIRQHVLRKLTRRYDYHTVPAMVQHRNVRNELKEQLKWDDYIN